MSLRRAAPGPQLSAGRIRVDAGKAIAKLREYQLADRSAWVLEAIRAAVAANATAIRLAADANDVWLSWDGEPLPTETLPRLFDELVSPEAASETHHVRLLAAGVNSALGMDPQYLDVVAIRDGSATRVRYTPEILVEPTSELGESALHHVAVEPVAMPERAPRTGMYLHLRRRLVDWRVLTAPPELDLAYRACRDISVPLHIKDVVEHRDSSQDVVRIPLGDGLDGFLAVVDVVYARHAPRFDIAERGVLLSESSFELDELPAGEARGPIPIRLFIDAPRMPTNASRSQVRRDAFPIEAAERRARELLPQLLGELAKAVQQGSERARASALALLTAVAGGGSWHADVPAIRGPLREIAQLPLVRNAVGLPRALTASWRPEIHLDDKPFSVELAPWLEFVLWAPKGDPARQLFWGSPVDTRGTRRLARYARQQLRAQKRFFAHEKRELRVLSAEEPHIRTTLGVAAEGSCVAPELFAELKGEVCIYTEGTTGALAVLLDGRALDRVEFDSPLAFDVVIDSAKVTPGDRYRGAKRDAEYKRVERAMRAGLVRALEAHALGKRDSDDAAIDARLFRKGFGVLSELGLPVRGPLERAPAYRTPDGRWLSLIELRKENVVGIAPPGKSVSVPEGRVVVELDENERRVLASLGKATLVPYRRTNVSGMLAIATSVAMQGGGAAFVVREPGLVAVLTPADRPRLRLHHLGAELGERSYHSKWLACTIAIDSDAIVPDTEWTDIVDDAGLGGRDYGPWELALIRALASAVVGEPPPDLVLTLQSWVELDSKPGRALCEAILAYDPHELLGPELVSKLRTAPLVRQLGAPELCSITHVAEQFPGAIPHLEGDAEPVDGFAPLVGTTLEARALARLVVRDIADATATLQRKHRDAQRQRRLASHRFNPPTPWQLPAVDHVELSGKLVHGLLGVWHGPFEITVFVEGRQFFVIHPGDHELPIVATVEIDQTYCDATFEGIDPDVRATIAAEVRLGIQPLLVDIAKRTAAKLADRGPARTLLLRAPPLTSSTRLALRAAPAFPTIQGARISIDDAAQPRMIISVASWQGDWLGPGDGESPSGFDAPILAVPDAQHEISRIIDNLHGGSVVDVTEDVTRLQTRRRIARGLLPTPKVMDAPATLKRQLSELGELGKRIGVGEIALVEENVSLVRLHDHGNFVRGDSIDVLPPITLAVELAESIALREPVQELAAALAKQVLASVPIESLSPSIQRNLMRAALARRIDRDVLASLPLWQDFLAQIDKLGDAWVVCEPTELEPLDENRHVFCFERDTFVLARDNGWHVVDALKELQLDATARKNRARKPAASLELPRTGVLAEVLLEGDGVTSPRGVVGVLSPMVAHARGVWPHIKMHPFDRVEDPCRWPTVAVVDDARLVPDRTWQAPLPNGEWQAVAKEVRSASESALATYGEIPEDALVSMRINNHACADVGALRKAPKSLIRGVLWLIGEPQRDVGVQVSGVTVSRFVPDHQLALGGKLLVYAPDGLDVAAALQQLCGQIHGKLVRQLIKQEHDKDLIAAHVAHALAIRTVRANDVRGIDFTCFSPRRLDARALTSLFRREDQITVIHPDATPDPDPHVIEVVDNDSLLSRVVINHLGSRIRRQRPAPKPRAAPVAPQPGVIPAPPKFVPPPKPKPPEPPHALKSLVGALRGRLADLGIGGYQWSIVDRVEPMFHYSDEIEVAGDNVRLRALAAAQLANSPLTTAGIDVIVAHLVTVLNVALSQITDASEAHAIGVLLVNRPSANQPRSHRS